MISTPKIKGDETNETIEDITRKNSAPIPIINNPTPTPNRRANMLKPSFRFHYPARRRLHPGLAVRSERQPPRPARYRFDARTRTSGRLQHQERRRGLCDPERRALKQFLTSRSSFYRPSYPTNLPTSQEPPTTRPGCPPAGSLCVWGKFSRDQA